MSPVANLIICPSAAYFLLSQQSVHYDHLSLTATKFWSPGWPLKTGLAEYQYNVIEQSSTLSCKKTLWLCNLVLKFNKYCDRRNGQSCEGSVKFEKTTESSKCGKS